MADYRFGCRSCNPSYEEYPWEEGTCPSDLPTHPVGMDPHPVRMDPNGRTYGTAWNPCQKQNGGYLMQTEANVVHPPAYGGYRCAPPKADYRMNSDFVDNSKWHRSSPMPGPHYDRPPEVDKFLTKVQAEASQPLGFSPPVNRNWSYNCGPPEYEENYTRYQDEGRRPSQFGAAPPARSNWARNPDPVSHDMYPAQPGYHASLPTRIERSTIEPSSASGLGRWGNYPGMVNQYRQSGRDSSLSKPTDDLNEIAEYLKQAAMPLSEPKLAMPKRDLAPQVSGVEGVVKPHNSFKSEPERKPKSKPELTTAHAAHTGTITGREAVPTTADMVHTGTITSREAVKRFGGVLM